MKNFRQILESLNEEKENGYIGFYGGKKVEVYASTSLDARNKAEVEFKKLFPRKKIKGYDVTVKLAEKDGKEVKHTAVD